MSLVVFLPLVHVAGHAVDLGLTPAFGAVLLAIVSGVSAVARLGVAWVVAPQRMTALFRTAHLVVVVAFVVWAAAGPGSAPVVLVVFAVVFGIGYGGWMALSPALLAASARRSRLGRAQGALAAVTGLGGALGPLLATPLLAAAPRQALLAAAVVALAATTQLRAPRHDVPRTSSPWSVACSRTRWHSGRTVRPGSARGSARSGSAATAATTTTCCSPAGERVSWRAWYPPECDHPVAR
jgi:MFS family permease